MYQLSLFDDMIHGRVCCLRKSPFSVLVSLIAVRADGGIYRADRDVVRRIDLGLMTVLTVEAILDPAGGEYREDQERRC